MKTLEENAVAQSGCCPGALPRGCVGRLLLEAADHRMLKDRVQGGGSEDRTAGQAQVLVFS